ncbi:dTMP kinase [Rothia sp. ZJ1223]|uniref:dTMP kinase n=1 Tax=Rothia sp. ZJ1223 TaxID=2811098 RepID=UPI00195E858D|nr:dTMP kinase [Rothia sp. ZJ1223]
MNTSLHFTPATAPNAHTCPGSFIVFEGGDGSGKTTQIRLLADALRQKLKKVTVTREPGGTKIGEKLRALVLEHGNGEIDAHTEALIFAASRAAHAHQLIRPCIERGEVVLCDRYIDSSAAYQGAGRGLGIDTIVDLSRWATNDLTPDLTIVLDVPLAVSRERAGARGAADRMESESDDFHAALSDTFIQRAAADPARYVVIDATGTLDDVHQRVLDAVSAPLGLGA